jgi:hypothetical protein
MVDVVDFRVEVMGIIFESRDNLKEPVSSFIDVLVKHDGVEAFAVLGRAVDVSTLEMPVEEDELIDVEIGVWRC